MSAAVKLGLAALFALCVARGEARAEEDPLPAILARAERELAVVFPNEPWELFCRVRWAATSSASATMFEPCDPETVAAPGFEPITMYVRITGDGKKLGAEMRSTGMRGCWKQPWRAFAPVKLVERGIESCSWARRLLVESRKAAHKFEHSGEAATLGPLYAAKLGKTSYHLALDPKQRLRWIQVGSRGQGTQIHLRPEGDALLPYRFRFQSTKGLAWFEWSYQQLEGRWLPHQLRIGSPKGSPAAITLEDCSLNGGAWSSAKPIR